MRDQGHDHNGRLYTCDIVCWGTASPLAFQAYLAWLENSLGETVTAYYHKRKLPGVRGTREVAVGETSGSQLEQSVWSGLWYMNLCRSSCYVCQYHSVDRPGDLTIGDYWGVSDRHGGIDDGHGISCLLVNNRDGLDLLQMAERQLLLVRSDLASIANRRQPMLAQPPSRDKSADVFWKSLHAEGFGHALESWESVKRIADGVAVPRLTRLRSLIGACFRLMKHLMMSLTQPSYAAEWREADMEELSGDTTAYPIAYAAKNASDAVRMRSSSGGMFHALASAVIDAGGVVYGCAFDEGLRAVHIRCEDMSSVERCMGSKYSQSDMGSTIRQVKDDLHAGRKVLFTGTPCQVDAVRRVCGDSVREGAASH